MFFRFVNVKKLFVLCVVGIFLVLFDDFSNIFGTKINFFFGSSSSNRNLRDIESVLLEDDENMTRLLNESAVSLCSDDAEEEEIYPLPNYESWCNHQDNSTILNVIPFFGGMTNALKFVLLGALMSLDEGRCFYISEKNAHLNPGFLKKHSESGEDGFFTRHFFEMIGLPNHHPYVKKAFEEGRTRTRMWGEYWHDIRDRRGEKEIYDYGGSDNDNNNNNIGGTRKERKNKKYMDAAINNLGISSTIDGHSLKRNFLRRMWHLRPSYKNETCSALKEHGIVSPYTGNYIAYSVRRGDKNTEGFTFPKMMEYIRETEQVLPGLFPNVTDPVPTIFVATDDCSVMKRLRELRPKWNFESQCYTPPPIAANATEEKGADTQHGYRIKDVPGWSYQQREQHFKKFFVELYALSLAKVYIGVAYTNVAWFSYFMRPKMDKGTFILLDQKKAGYNNVHDW